MGLYGRRSGACESNLQKLNLSVFFDGNGLSEDRLPPSPPALSVTLSGFRPPLRLPHPPIRLSAPPIRHSAPPGGADECDSGLRGRKYVGPRPLAVDMCMLIFVQIRLSGHVYKSSTLIYW